MDKFVIEGQHPLQGALPVGGSKNTALPLMAAALLADGTTTLTNIPTLRDVTTFAHVLRISGAAVRHNPDAHTLTVDASRVDFPEAPYALVKKMRASFYMLGALLGRCGEARVSLPGGCAWGPRPVDLHLKGMEAFGAHIDLEAGYVIAKTPRGGLPGGTFRMEPSSVGATVNLTLAACTARGSSRIENAAREPDVVAFCKTLQQMGARIEGIGTTTLEIEGVDRLQPVDVANTPDRIELGTYMIAAALAGTPGQPLRITGGNTDHLGHAFANAFAQTGTGIAHEPNGDLLITRPEELQPVSITTNVYPGFPTDLQAQWTVLMTQAAGPSTVTDTIYSDRFKHIPELNRMGISARVEDDTVYIEGNQQVMGAEVMSTDLRASVSLVLAGMIAEGTTDVLRVYHLDRGYEHLEQKLNAVGAKVERVAYDEFATPAPQEA